MVARDRTEQRKRDLDLQLRYLKLADRLGLHIDWNHYAAWGTPEEVRAMPFKQWWRERGSKLIAEGRASAITVDCVTNAEVVIRIPRQWTVRKVAKEIGAVFAPHRKLQGKTRRIRPKEFADYARLLELELAEQAQGQPLGEKFERLKASRVEIEKRTKAWRETRAKNLAKEGKRLRADRRTARVKIVVA